MAKIVNEFLYRNTYRVTIFKTFMKMQSYSQLLTVSKNVDIIKPLNSVIFKTKPLKSLYYTQTLW